MARSFPGTGTSSCRSGSAADRERPLPLVGRPLPDGQGSMYVRAGTDRLRGYARPSWSSNRGPALSWSVPTGLARPISSRRRTTWPPSPRTGSQRTSAGAGRARSGGDPVCHRRTKRELLVELSIEPGRANRARLDGAHRSPGPATSWARCGWCCSPQRIWRLVRGDPAERRRYLDDLLVPRQPRYAGVLADYDRVLKQRNALLRSPYLARKVGGSRGGDLSTFDVWDMHLAQHGAQLLAGRLELCAALSPLATAYDAVSGAARDATTGRDRLRFPPSGTAQTTVPAALEPAAGQRLGRRYRRTEIERGMTWSARTGTTDPVHRRSSGQGIRESWRVLVVRAGPRLAAYDLLRADGIEPVLVLDDVFAELDAGRRERLATWSGTPARWL